MSESGDFEIKAVKVSMDHDYEFNAPQYVDFAKSKWQNESVLWKDREVKNVDGEHEDQMIDCADADVSTAAESTSRDIETIGSPPESMLEILETGEENKTATSHDLEGIRTGFENDAFEFIPDTRRRMNLGAFQVGQPKDSCSLKGKLSDPGRTKEGFLIPKPFVFHQTLGCHGHEKRKNGGNSYIPLAVTLKAFENTRSLPYDPPRVGNWDEWPRNPTRPKSPPLLTKFRRRNHPNSLKSTDEIEFNMMLNMKPFKAKPVNLKPLDSPRIKISTKPEPFSLAGDRISSLKRQRFANYLRKLEEEEKNARNFRARPLPSCMATNLSSRSDELSSSLSGSELKHVIDRVNLLGKRTISITSSLSNTDSYTSKNFHASPVPDFSKIFIPKKSCKKPTEPAEIILHTELRSKEREPCCTRKSLANPKDTPKTYDKDVNISTI